MTEWITQIDFTILYWIQNTFRCAFLDFLMPKVTLLGNAGLIWLLIAAVLLFQKKYRRTGILLLAGLLAGVLIGNAALKNLVARARPCWIDTTVQMLVSVPKDFSFPSGHTLSSVIAATILTGSDRHFGFFAIPVAVLIALSRLYLFVHFPSDVLAAALLGLLIGFAVLIFGGKLLDRILEKISEKKNRRAAG